jgi:hypothetical protein
MELDVELLIDEVLNFLFLPGLALCKQIKEPLSLLLIELRGRPPPKLGVRSPRPPLFQSVAHRLPVD